MILRWPDPQKSNILVTHASQLFPCVLSDQAKVKALNWGNWTEEKRDNFGLIYISMETQQRRKQKLQWAGWEINLCTESSQNIRYFTFKVFPTLKATKGKKTQQSTGYLTHPIIGFTTGRAPIMPSTWAPDGNVKINIATTAGLEGSKWHGENNEPKEQRQCLGTAVMAHKVRLPVGTDQ